MKFFGREPAALAAAIQSILALAIAFGWLSWIGLETQADIGIVMAVLGATFAVFLAYTTTETLLAPVVELFKALLALGAIYGFQISIEQTAMAIAAINMTIGAWQRTQVSPLNHPSFGYVAPNDTLTPKAA